MVAVLPDKSLSKLPELGVCTLGHKGVLDEVAVWLQRQSVVGANIIPGYVCEGKWPGLAVATSLCARREEARLRAERVPKYTRNFFPKKEKIEVACGAQNWRFFW